MKKSFEILTKGRGTVEITHRVAELVAQAKIDSGLCTLFCHHTSASLILCENADPTVRRDLETWMAGAVTDGDPRFAHTAEGADDMPAHIRSVLTTTSLAIPVSAGRLDVGTWQGIFLWEHRHHPHRRRLTVVVTAA